MGLNKSNGNMYDWITHTWNTVKGACPHNCSYCYMKRFGKQPALHFDEKELKTNLGNGNFIFVGSSCDLFANDIRDEWINKTLEYCRNFNNKYLFQTKNPSRIWEYVLPENSTVCTTIETNRWYQNIMNNSPVPYARVIGIHCINLPKYVTIEPIMDFDLDEMVEISKKINPIQINIGADTGRNNLPEPSKEKILELIAELEQFTIVKQKGNLNRLMK